MTLECRQGAGCGLSAVEIFMLYSPLHPICVTVALRSHVCRVAAGETLNMPCPVGVEKNLGMPRGEAADRKATSVVLNPRRVEPEALFDIGRRRTEDGINSPLASAARALPRRWPRK